MREVNNDVRLQRTPCYVDGMQLAFTWSALFLDRKMVIACDGLQPGTLFTFAPERFSRLPRNRVHVPPESAQKAENRKTARGERAYRIG